MIYECEAAGHHPQPCLSSAGHRPPLMKRGLGPLFQHGPSEG